MASKRLGTPSINDVESSVNTEASTHANERFFDINKHYYARIRLAFNVIA